MRAAMIVTDTKTVSASILSISKMAELSRFHAKARS